LKPRK